MNNLSLSPVLPFLTTVVVSFLGYVFLLTKLNRKIKIFHVCAEKSASNAVLMGGVPLILGITSGILLLKSSSILSAWLGSSIIISIGGWIDDRWEVRARVKLFFQGTGSLLFAYQAASQMEFFWPSFLVISFLGMALLNGTNLLDGLDTMLIKLKSISFLGFLWFAFQYNSPQLINLSLIGIFALLSFYPFNRFPSKIHQGEVGSSYLGFFSLLLGVVFIQTSNRPEAISLSYTLIILSLPISELCISFTRRILTKRSPFRGDRLHLHHVLKNKFHWSPLKTTSVLALTIGCFMIVTFSLARIIHPAAAMIIHYILTSSLYVAVCYKVWAQASSHQSSSLFLEINKNKIDFIDVKIIDQIPLNLTEISSEKIQKIA